MRIPTFPRSTRAGINMTPMIDVVFLLIIFFLVSSHLARQDATLPVDLPEAVGGEADAANARPRITITVQEDGQIWWGGQNVSAEALRPRLQAMRRAEQEDVELRIRASRLAPYRAVEPLLAAAAEAGIWNLTFAVYEQEQAK